MIVDIITKKKEGKILSRQELEYFFNGYLNGEVEDYQMSSLLMAICLKGMTDKEIFELTDIYIKSGEILDFSEVEGIKVDKHSTGGVGDKTTLIIAPIVASLGIPVVKMSGRGLGFTGGTIDKIESIEGFQTNRSMSAIKKQVKEIGISLSSQTSRLAPMDKKIYALRDVTGTVESIPLIAASIMSKKIASGADKILIDIKVGKGALIKNQKDAKKLKDLMIRIGNHYGREVRCIISDMNNPLGSCIGNAIEVFEAMEILKGKEKNSLLNLCIDLSSEMVSMAKNISKRKAIKLVKDSINSKKAYDKFLELVRYQQGDISSLKVSDKTIEIKSTKKGVVKSINALKFGELSVRLGAGRQHEDDKVNHGVGIKLNKLVGDKVKLGDTLCTLFVEKEEDFSKVEKYYTIQS